ncbi:MAG: hypothetical protein ABI406_17330 [Ktedonobacteraceae bacterium]
MSKKTRMGYNGAQRSKTKSQKGFELVRSERLAAGEEQQRHALKEQPFESARSNASIAVVTRREEDEDQLATGKDSAYARKPPYRATRKVQQRNLSVLVTAEGFRYVKHDLITIGILTSIMIVILLVFTYILGVG